MNYEINDYYDSRLEFLENQNEFQNNYENNFRNNEEEVEFQVNNGKISNNIGPYFQQRFLSPDINRNMNQNSISNMSYNFLPSEQQNNNYYNNNSNSMVANSPMENRKNNNFDNYDNYDNNNNNYYINENNSITLLNLTDKIYEDDDHLKKDIITKKASKGISGKFKPKKKKSSRNCLNGNNNKKIKKNMLILSDNKDSKDNKEFNKKNNDFKKRRASVAVDHFNKNSFGDFYKIRQKQRKNSAIVHFKRGNNNDVMKKKNKFRKNNSKQAQDDSFTSNNQEFQLIKNKKSRPSKTNKNKIPLPISETEKKKNEEEEEEKEKISEKKTNILKIESLYQNIQNDENSKVQNEKKSEIYKTKKKYCLFCCLNSNLNDSDIK